MDTGKNTSLVVRGQPGADATANEAGGLPPFRHPQDIIYVAVGPEGKRFGMHKDHLTATSPYFRAALNGKFKEASMGIVTLKETSVATYSMFNEWLYTGKITDEPCMEKGLSVSGRLAKDKPTFPQLLDVWLLADYLLVPQLKNFINEKMVAKYEVWSVTPNKDFKYFYENTEPGSPMRKFMVDLCVWRRHQEGEAYWRNIDCFPPEMVADILVTFSRRIEGLDRDPFSIQNSRRYDQKLRYTF